MREIKFRVWNKKLEQMIYGWGCFTDTSSIQHVIDDGGERFPGYLMQYTGLKDKNGKEIYEGDIVKSEQWNPSVYQVCFDRGAFYIAKKDKHEVADIKYVEEFEVIGNVFSNPELLKNDSK